MSERTVSFVEATQCLRQHAALVTVSALETVPLRRAAGRVLAADVSADRDFPPFARSTRDGYAVCAGGTGRLVVIGEVRAGEQWAGPMVDRKSCVSIMTGAPMPAGADAVVMLEHAAHTEGSIVLQDGGSVQPGENVVLPGSEAKAGAVVLPPGQRLTAARIGMAAACGAAELQVYSRPRVAVLATGDELVELDRTPGPAQIRNSNSYALAAAVESAGGEAVVLDVARDSVASLEQQLEAAFACDLVVVAGGVSAGKYDLAERVLSEKFGAEFLFTGVQMQPGRPMVFGRTAKGKYFFGLPGNPVSALVTFGVLARHLLAAMCGEAGWQPRFCMATLEEPVKVAAGLTRFLPAEVRFSVGGTVAGEATVRRLAWQGSGDMAAAAGANGYLVVPPECERMAAGDRVSVWLPE